MPTDIRVCFNCTANAYRYNGLFFMETLAFIEVFTCVSLNLKIWLIFSSLSIYMNEILSYCEGCNLGDSKVNTIFNVIFS